MAGSTARMAGLERYWRNRLGVGARSAVSRARSSSIGSSVERGFNRAGGVLGIVSHLNVLVQVHALKRAQILWSGRHTLDHVGEQLEDAMKDVVNNAKFIAIPYAIWAALTVAKRWFGVPVPKALIGGR